MRIRILTVGRPDCAWADAAVDDYVKRLRRWARVEQDHVKPEKYRGDEDAVREAEGERLLAEVSSRDHLIALDERGRGLTSQRFARLLKQARSTSMHRLTFALGGPYGLSPAVRQQADLTLKLSSMVLNHEVARVVLIEQIYRGMSILAGAPYHH